MQNTPNGNARENVLVGAAADKGEEGGERRRRTLTARQLFSIVDAIVVPQSCPDMATWNNFSSYNNKMDISKGKFSLTTGRQMELVDITAVVENFLKENTCLDGLLYLFNPHTTAGLTINEGADPAVCQDIRDGLRALVPINYPFRHTEGNSPAHIMASLCGASLTIAVTEGHLLLGQWQHIFFCEFDGPRKRFVHWRFLS